MSDTKNPINFDAPGNHSDVGGSYPENEARLSDISQGSMVHAAGIFPTARRQTASASSWMNGT
jgi:hypothetical protein